MTYRGYSIEQERNGTFSLYSLRNSMYDCHHGFKSIEDAQEATKALARTKRPGVAPERWCVKGR